MYPYAKETGDYMINFYRRRHRPICEHLLTHMRAHALAYVPICKGHALTRLG